MPGQEPGTRPHRRSLHHAARRRHRQPLRLHGDRNDVQRGRGRRLAAGLPRQVPGRLGDSVHGRQAAPARPTRGPRPTTDSHGYAFSIYGPDGFVRSFAGDIVARRHHDGADPPGDRDAGRPGPRPSLRLTLANDGTTAVAYTLTASDYGGTTQTLTVGANGSATVAWPVDADGYYDVIITANTSDGFTRRYAGRIA